MLAKTLLLAFLLALPIAAVEAVEAPSEDIPWALDTVLAHVPPLTHDATGRLPMVTWDVFRRDAKDDSWDRAVPLPDAAYRELAKRGLTQHIPFQARFIPMAQAMQRAGAKVIVVEGAGGNGPGAEAPDTLHKLPADYKIPAGEQKYVCPLDFDGWRNCAERIRKTLKEFKDAGVTIDAIWLDWEVEPLCWSKERWRQAQACERCRTQFPPGVLDSWESYWKFIYRQRAELFSTYVAAPILEYYPQCSITNWEAVISSPEIPTQTCWGGSFFPSMTVGLFNATNPVAYGNDVFYHYHWKKEWNYPLDEPHMDRVYTHVMLGQVSQNAANLQRWAPDKQSIPWVCRYCPDMEDKTIPVLSRPRYREILRHIWLRGANGMQIFNALRARQAYALEEIEDAVAVFDEMLAFRKFLEKGRVMNVKVPDVTENGAIWSGLQVGDEAVVRTFTQADTTTTFAIAPWLDAQILVLEAPPEGATYLLTRQGDKVKVERQPPTR